MKYTIHVTEEDSKNAMLALKQRPTRGISDVCPLTIAIQRATQNTNLVTGMSWVCLRTGGHLVQLPEAALAYRRDFDREYHRDNPTLPAPITFELEL